MKKYNQINNALGWLMFIIAAATYLLTLEPTASFWDCGEFIAQGYKLEVGHPPGNPIFMLVARFFINFSSDPSTVAICVNTMSGLLSAATILLLFWTITSLVERLVHRKGGEEYSLAEMLVIFGSGVVGSLAYTWSDTFWFSAVEGEVYAFSSFCTALVFWLILKWERRADDPSSDRYLILIAYVIGISVAVHLLNLLCIPAIVLVFYYRKWTNTNAKGSLLALLVSFGIIVAILYGLVPGFVKVAQWFELACVNTLGMSFNMGVLIYLILDIALYIWCIYELYQQNSPARIKMSFLLSIFFSGMLFIGDGWLLPVLLTAALVLYLAKFCPRIPVRIFNIVIMSIFVIFIGYSSYALIIIRSTADTPMDQNSPDNVFALASYLNREQYGQRPLLYGQTFNAPIVYKVKGDIPRPYTKTGKKLYEKKVKASPDEPDRYEFTGYEETYVTSPELDMLFPRMYDGTFASQYQEWIGMKGTQVKATTRIDADGNTIETRTCIKPTFAENLQFFFDYQLNYMYWRYFMWNFAGRQNDIQGSGELNHGNWISGIPFIDNPRLGDQSLLPDDLGKGNRGHNVFYLLPLLLGIIGLLWQAYAGKKGIEQFWVIFWLFFMTGLAIVIYLNQTPSQPRERDYAFAGSFYAFAIWIGMGVAGLWRLAVMAMNRKDKAHDSDTSFVPAFIAVAIGIIVPLQMVSQTWDDHDRSGRYACRDFGMNYLSGVGDHGIIFTNGDNDTFPLWYAQEVEGYRTDVRVVNLSYLSTSWYIDQMRRASYESEPLTMLSEPSTFAYSERQYNYFIEPDETPVPALESLKQLYGPDYKTNDWHLPMMNHPVMYIPVDKESVVKNGIVAADEGQLLEDRIELDMLHEKYTSSDGAMSSSKVSTIDIIASNAAEGWKRPVYFAMTVPDRYYIGLDPYMRLTGITYEVTPILSEPPTHSEYGVNTDRMYENVTTKFRWGGLDVKPDQRAPYVDETVGRMITTHRSALLDLTNGLIEEGVIVKAEVDSASVPMSEADREKFTAFSNDRFERARNVLALMDEKLPTRVYPYSIQMGYMVANAYLDLGHITGNEPDTKKGKEVLVAEIMRYAQYMRYYQNLSMSNYNRLTRNDWYIRTSYLPGLLSLYGSVATAEEYKDIWNKVAESGVNVQEIMQRLTKDSE